MTVKNPKTKEKKKKKGSGCLCNATNLGNPLAQSQTKMMLRTAPLQFPAHGTGTENVSGKEAPRPLMTGTVGKKSGTWAAGTPSHWRGFVGFFT